jgi:hypothetical protein
LVFTDDGGTPISAADAADFGTMTLALLAAESGDRACADIGAAHPEAVFQALGRRNESAGKANPASPTYGPEHAFHHWGEPLFGYYKQDDRYVIRKHLRMLTDAGVDVLLLDVTNALTYDSVRDSLLAVMDEINATGQRTPKIAFLANSASAQTVGHLYQTFHKPGKGRAHWAEWLGKPLLLAAAKVSADPDNLYFYASTSAPLTATTDPNWMLLFIDADNNPKTGWLGYDYVINRTHVRPGITTLERNDGGGYQWKAVREIGFHSAGNELEAAIPRVALGITAETFTLDFKWADNILQTGEWSDFTLNGDVAPNDRFNFRANHGYPHSNRMKHPCNE